MISRAISRGIYATEFANWSEQAACTQTSPISFASRGKWKTSWSANYSEQTVNQITNVAGRNRSWDRRHRQRQSCPQRNIRFDCIIQTHCDMHIVVNQISFWRSKKYYIENITWRREGMNFIFEWYKTIYYERGQRVSKILFFTTRKQNSYLQATV